MAEWCIQFLGGDAASPWAWVVYVGVALFQVGVILAIVMTIVPFATWAERKIAGRIQDRLGPTRVGGRFGWLQPLADGLKLLSKEDLIPRDADGFLFRLAPYAAFAPAFAVFLALPFADGWVAQHLNIAVFFILAVAGLEIFGIILGGYSSGSKWSLLGAMREGAQVVSYEVPLTFSAVIPVLIAGTMDLTAIGNMQRGWFWNWFLFHDPFTFVAFWIYMTCATAGTNRAPFDLAEAESELVAGFHTEYSGFRWSVFFMGEYASMTAFSGLAAILFLGGWNGPIPILSAVGLTAGNGALAGFVGNLLGAVNFLVKCSLGVVFMMWLRWTLPRLRIDQVITMCWKYCFPLVCLAFAGAVLWTYFFPGGLIFGRPLGTVPEVVSPGRPAGVAPLAADRAGNSGCRAIASAAQAAEDRPFIPTGESALDVEPSPRVEPQPRMLRTAVAGACSTASAVHSGGPLRRAMTP